MTSLPVHAENLVVDNASPELGRPTSDRIERAAWRMRDVARLAGVSRQTVSRVLNNPEVVSPETAKRVLDVISSLGYHPSSSARALTTGRSGVIGVVDSGSRSLGQTYLLGAVERAARRAGYAIHATVLESDSDDAIRDAFRQLIHRDVEGIVVLGSTVELNAAAERVGSSIPVAIVDTAPSHHSPVIHVGVDSETGGAVATRHLIGLGRRRIAHVSGTREWLHAKGRIAGWRVAMAEAGLVPDLLVPGDWSPEAGYEAGRALIARDVDAVFAANDHMALGLMWALTEHGLRIPEDVAVVGFDNLPGSAMFTPPLTTMEQPFAELGTQCVSQLLAAFRGQPTRDVILQARLIVRHSTVTPHTATR